MGGGGCTPTPFHILPTTGPMSFLGGGLHLYPIILRLVPCPFWGRGYPSPRWKVLDWMGYPPGQDWMGYPLQPGPDGAPPSLDWMGYHPGQDWMGYPLQPGMDGASLPLRLDGVPSCQEWMGYSLQPGLNGYHPRPPPVRTGWGTPTPLERLCLGRLRRGRYVSCGVSRDDFLVTISFHFYLWVWFHWVRTVQHSLRQQLESVP